MNFKPYQFYFELIVICHQLWINFLGVSTFLNFPRVQNSIAFPKGKRKVYRVHLCILIKSIKTLYTILLTNLAYTYITKLNRIYSLYLSLSRFKHKTLLFEQSLKLHIFINIIALLSEYFYLIYLLFMYVY